ncbi:MAG: hypothetical protein RLZZ58_162 [Pseudomonadota bacterium]
MTISARCIFVLMLALTPLSPLAAQADPAPAAPSASPEQAALDAAVAELSAEKPAPVPTPRAIPAKPCSLTEHRQFDFWLGDWDVTAVGSDRLVANSRIEAKYGGCAIRENWMPMGRTGGGSLNSFDVRLGKWRQTWVDSTGAWVLFEGGMTDGAMELTGIWRDYGGPGNDPLIKMRYEVKGDGSVRQWGQQSTDGGVTWTTSFDLIYKRRATPLQP